MIAEWDLHIDGTTLTIYQGMPRFGRLLLERDEAGERQTGHGWTRVLRRREKLRVQLLFSGTIDEELGIDDLAVRLGQTGVGRI